MKNLILFTVFLFAISSLFGQADQFVEIQVNEIVELKVKKVTVIVQKGRYYGAFGEIGDGDYPEVIAVPPPVPPSDYEDDYEYEKSDWQLDREYEEMLENNPKDITKEMRVAYEQRKKQREEEIKLLLEEEKESKLAIARSLKETETYLKSKKIRYTVDKVSELKETAFYRSRRSQASDTVFVLEFYDQKSYEECRNALKEKAITFDIYDVQYQDYVKDIAPTLLPNMLEKAKKEAKVLADVMNRRIGQIESVSNAIPFNTMNLSSEMFEIIQKNMRSNSDDINESNPFSKIDKDVKSYIFRFYLVFQ